jgi:hypothetical protein
MTVAATKQRISQADDQPPVKARELMERLNADASKLNIWVRTEMNAPAQRAWFTDPGGESGAGQLAAGGRVSANQVKALPTLWRNTFMAVMDGEGYTEVGGKRFAWTQNDILVMPNFLWRRHFDTGKSDAGIYTVSDTSLMRNIGQYRAQGKAADGSVAQLVE